MDFLQIVQWILFAIVTIFLIAISYKSLQNIKTHGFYRFFAFEFTAILVIINLPYWFYDPFCLIQILSWIILFISLLMEYFSFYYLTKLGGTTERNSGSANFNFENTANLVDTGIYKYIRHPMYSSLFYLALGTMLKYLSLPSICLTAFAILFLVFTAKTEETENIAFFGNAYKDYINRTKMFIPFIF